MLRNFLLVSLQLPSHARGVGISANGELVEAGGGPNFECIIVEDLVWVSHVLEEKA